MSKEFKISLFISILIIVFAVTFVIFKRPTQISENINQNKNIDLVQSLANEKFLGNAEAEPFVIFEDPQCPFCKKFFQEVEGKIYENFVATGKIKLIVKPLPILGEESNLAVKALWCAGEQGNFWEFREILFTNQRGENLGAFKKENLIKFAQNLNLDINNFENCLQDPKWEEKIKENKTLARNLKINGTPSFWFKSKAYVGFMSYDKIKDIIIEK